MMFAAIVYATGSLLHRRTILSDNAQEFIGACGIVDGETLINLTGRELPPFPLTVEQINALIAEDAGVAVDALPSGRCAVVLPETREVIEFIVADPALDVVAEEHHLGGDCACELHATEDAKLGDKILECGTRLARVVGGDPDGTVQAVDWVAPDQIPDGYVEDSAAQPGDVIEALKLTDVASEGTVKL